MKKNYLWSVIAMAFFTLFISCNQEEQEIELTPKTTLEPDFFELDGAMGIPDEEQLAEEEAPEESKITEKTYYNYYRSYTLLKPSHVSEEKMNATCGEATTMPLLVGSSKKKVGEVIVRNDEENLYLTFKADDKKYMKKVYLQIGAKEDIPFYSNGFPNLRKFNYKAFPYYYGGMKHATYVIPLSSIDTDCFEIVAYSKVYDANSRCYYTSFAYDSSLDQGYSYGNYSRCYYYTDWVRSFEFCKKDCNPVECVEVMGYHDACGFCENGELQTFLAYVYLNNLGAAGIDFEILKDINDCDTSSATEVGNINISSISDTELRIEYTVDAGYELCEINFDYGKSSTELDSNYSIQFDEPTTSHTFTITRPEFGANIHFTPKAKISM